MGKRWSPQSSIHGLLLSKVITLFVGCPAPPPNSFEQTVEHKDLLQVNPEVPHPTNSRTQS